MSGTGESDDGYENFNCRAKKRKIIMRIEFNDADEASTDSDVSESNIKPSQRNLLKRNIISSDESSPSDGEVYRTNRAGDALAYTCDEKVSQIKKNVEGYATDSSSDETREKCPVCLLTFRNQEIASPATCDHIFCFICLEEWARNVTTCPIDRCEFKTIIVRDSFHTKKIVREVKADVEKSYVEQESEDITYCEICQQPNREDVMLLCDGCNQGYHMDCLSPPLTDIPEGSWYCDHCFESEGEDNVDDLNLVYEDLREMGVSETRLRITEVRQPRVPRTRQVEMIRARVFARNTNARLSLANNINHPVASTSTRERVQRRTRKRKVVRRRRTYVVEYDVNSYDEKFSIKTTKRFIRRRRKSKKKTKKANTSSRQMHVRQIPRSDGRSLLAASPFSLFGNRNELEYFSDSEDVSTVASGAGSTSVQTIVRLRNPTLQRTKGLLPDIRAPTPQIDILSDIMDLQDRWLNTTRQNQFSNILIGTDGTLTFERDCLKKNITEKKDNKKCELPINEAPLYPRGNNSNYSGGDRYDTNSNNYRNSTGFQNTGSQYRHSTGNSGFNLNPFRRDESSGQYNRSIQHVFSNNIQISPGFSERVRGLQNLRSDRRNSNRFSNEIPEVSQSNEQTETALSDIASSGVPEIESNLTDNLQNSSNICDNSNLSTENLPLSFSTSELNSSILPSVVPPLAPPPWNKNLFRLAGDYDDDDDADCPNFSIYSAESLQVARSSKDNDECKPMNTGGQEDDFEEKEEDLVQLGDDDEIPDAIESGKKDTNNSTDIYKPENPTKEVKNDPENKNDCKEEKSEKNSEDSDYEKDMAIYYYAKKYDDKQSDPNENNKKTFLELYDESDWDEWNVDKNKLKNTCVNISSSKKLASKEKSEKDENITGNIQTESISESIQENMQTDTISESIQGNMQTDSINETVQDNMQTESISEEEDRSYTPCLDEKTEHDESTQSKDESHTPPKPSSETDKADSDRGDKSTTVIDGMETELISDEEEILNQDQSGNLKRKDKEKDENASKRTRKETFKKISKNTKGRNYRGDKVRTKGKELRSRSRTNDKENQNITKRNQRRRVRRKEIERYDVRNIIGQPRTYKDRYGRDTSRPPRSRTRTRSRSRRRKSRSRSKFRSRSVSSRRNRHSFSISPSPASYLKSSSCRRSLSSRKSRSRGSTSRRRASMRKRSKTPLRIRSPSPRANGRRKHKYRQTSLSVSSPSDARSRSRDVAQRRELPKTLIRIRGKRKRSKDRKKKKSKKRSLSLSISPSKRLLRQVGGHRDTVRKKKRRTRSKSPLNQMWSASSPRPVAAENNELSWTPPLVSSSNTNLTVILKNKEITAESKKKADKKKKKEKRRDTLSKKERRKPRSDVRESPVAPSKEVFASGDNILVSVSFNKEGNLPLAPPQQTTVVTLPPTREEIISKRRTPERVSKKQKKPKEKGQRRHKKVDTKPVAIIDLDRSPFQEIVQSPRDVIVLTDSDQEIDDHGEFNSSSINMEITSLEQTNGNHQHANIDKCVIVERSEDLQEESFESSLQQLGPKTPPEPPIIKFSLTAKAKQIKVRNPLHEEQSEVNNEQIEENVGEIEKSNTNIIGPNTPPESGPCSPDAYDPFDPTKSPSASPSLPPPADISTPLQNDSSPVENGREPRSQKVQERSMNPVDLVMALMNSKSNKSHEICNTNIEQQYAIPTNVEVNEIHDKTEEANITKSITVISNVLITPGKAQQRASNLPTIASPVSKASQPVGVISQSIVSKLPLPRTCSNNRQISGNDESMNEIESPYSPGSDDYDDLFEPPAENSTSLQQLSQRSRLQKSGANKSSKTELFDNLFGNTSPIKIPSYTPTAVRKRGMKSYKKTSVKGGL